jgi:ABC-type multidrug transport system fused ATPase/permease subunit
MRTSKFLLPDSGDQFYSAKATIKRLIADEGVRHWKKYVTAIIFMVITSGCTALVPYLFGQIVNQFQVHRSMSGVVIGSAIVFGLFVCRGFSAYGQSVVLARIANRVIVSHQRKVFLKLLNENLSFFADRHSTEFITRVNAGAEATAKVLNLLVTTASRDLLSMLGLTIVMITQDPVMSLSAILIAPPAWFVITTLKKRVGIVAKKSVSRHRVRAGDAAGDLAGNSDREGLHTRRHDARPVRQSGRQHRAGVEQDRAARQSFRAFDGNVGRPRACCRDHLWRLSHHRLRGGARRIRLVHRGVPAGL